MSSRLLVMKLLERVDLSADYVDRLLDQEFRRQKLSDQDKAFVQEVLFGVIRWRKRLNWIIQQLYQGSLETSPRFVRHILQMSLYQLMYMDRIPDYATIHEAVALARKKGGNYWSRKVNAILRTFQRQRDQITLPDRAAAPTHSIAIEYSHPEWLIERWVNRWGFAETCTLCEANNSRPLISLRVNQLKITSAELQNLLLRYDIKTIRSAYSDHFLSAETLPELSQFEPFQRGLFTIQDASAGLPCQLLAPQPGDKIIDLCAAPGGKTTYLAELTGDRAQIFALDRYITRLNLIKQHQTRLGLSSIQYILTDGTTFSSSPVDKVIVDAPCSGTGVLAKRVDLRWKRTLQQIQELSQLQSRLMDNAARLVKSGGVLVYCTCTIEPEENEQIIEKFLQNNTDFRLDSAANSLSEKVTNAAGFVATFPHRHGIDGSFAARLIKV